MTSNTTRALGVVGGALLGAMIGAFSPATAYAAPEVPTGAYESTEENGHTYDWTFTPCGSSCTSAYSQEDDSVRDLKFHLSAGTWSASGPWEVKCNDGAHPVTIHYSFDADTLAGSYFSTLKEPGCGEAEGADSRTVTFQLAKAG